MQLLPFRVHLHRLSALAIWLLGFTFMAGVCFAFFLTVLAHLRNHGEETACRNHREIPTTFPWLVVAVCLVYAFHLHFQVREG